MTLLYNCNAPADLFLENFDDVQEGVKAKIPKSGLGCDGGGVPGSWCRGCPWEERPEIEIDEVIP